MWLVFYYLLNNISLSCLSSTKDKRLLVLKHHALSFIESTKARQEANDYTIGTKDQGNKVDEYKMHFQ